MGKKLTFEELRARAPEDKWRLNVEWRKANPETGEGYVHEHDDYGMHPVTRKHRKRKLKATRRGKFVDYYFGRRWLFALSFKTEHDAVRAKSRFDRKDSIGKEGVIDYALYILEIYQPKAKEGVDIPGRNVKA